MTERAGVSVVVPLRGDDDYARRAGRAFKRLRLGPADELIVADNTPEGVGVAAFGGLARVVAAGGEASSYHARNVGAREAAGEWLLFVDADCIPDPGLIEAYMSEPIGAGAGAVAGRIEGIAEQDSLLARYTRDRNFFDQAEGLHGASGLAAATGNLLVRRATFEQLGGFAEGIRSGGDVDFCLRMNAAGWNLEQRPAAGVEHRHRESLVSFLGMLGRYGAGARWLNERHPDVAPSWPLFEGMLGSARDVGGHLLHGRLEPAAFRALDGIGLIAHAIGYRTSNRAGWP